MEKVLQEFRIIETDDGFRIEIKGDKEQLREWVMSLDPRRWMGRGPEWGFPFGPPPFMRGKWRKHGPFGAWFGFGEPDDDEDDEPHGKHKHHHGPHHHGGEGGEPDTV